MSAKIFDGLFDYAADMTPQPRLATGSSVSPDGRATTFKLRPDVRWHGGTPFSSADIAFSVMTVWKTYHSRGCSTFSAVEDVETPDLNTAILRPSKPSPFILSTLSSLELQVISRHLYEHGDVLTNPANLKPVGNEPYRFKQWERGSFLVLERNPDYWATDQPRLDTVIFRVLPEPSAHAEALQAGEIQASAFVDLTDIPRLSAASGLAVDRSTHACAESGWSLRVQSRPDAIFRRAGAAGDRPCHRP